VDLLLSADIQGVWVAGPESPAETISEQGVVTIRNATDMSYFSEAFKQAIAEHRHWERAKQKEMVPA
jgi:catalase